MCGYDRPTSPNIDAFARSATVFDTARASTSWTRPATATLFTGLGPRSHGVNGVDSALPNEAVTLAEILRASGYETAAFVVNANVLPQFGFDQGFGRFDDLLRDFNLRMLHAQHEAEAVHPKTDIVHEHAFQWLLSDRGERPFLLYVHTMDPHSPYEPKERFLRRIQPAHVRRELGSEEALQALQSGEMMVTPEIIGDLMSLYDAEIAQNDHYFGLLLSELRRLDLYDSSVIVLLSDHGEGFYEHGYLGHGNSLYEEVLRIPVVIKLPGQTESSSSRVAATFQQTDLLPTLAGLLGLKLNGATEGQNLADLLRDGLPPERVPHFALLRLPPFEVESVDRDEWKLIRTLSPGDSSPHLSLHRLSDDPEETRDWSSARPEVRRELRDLLDARAAHQPRWEVPRGSLGDVADRLRALGYLR